MTTKILPITTLSDYVAAIGNAYVYAAADPTLATSWDLLGITEGEIQVDESFQFNDYKLPEWTGDAVHLRNLDGVSIKLTIPLIWGNSALYTLVNPIGDLGGGRSAPTAVTTMTLLVLPQTEVSTGLSNGADGQTWTPVAPTHALWIHKATFEPGNYAFKHGDGGKVIRSVGVIGMFDDTKPEGEKIYTRGSPYAAGVTTYRI